MLDSSVNTKIQRNKITTDIDKISFFLKQFYSVKKEAIFHRKKLINK